MKEEKSKVGGVKLMVLITVLLIIIIALLGLIIYKIIHNKVDSELEVGKLENIVNNNTETSVQTYNIANKTFKSVVEGNNNEEDLDFNSYILFKEDMTISFYNGNGGTYYGTYTVENNSIIVNFTEVDSEPSGELGKKVNEQLTFKIINDNEINILSTSISYLKIGKKYALEEENGFTNNLSDAENGKIAFEKLVLKNELKTEQHGNYYTYIDSFGNKYNIKEITNVVSEKGIMGVDNWAALFKVAVTYIDNNNQTKTMDLAIVLLSDYEIQNMGTYLNYTGTTSFVKGFTELYDASENDKLNLGTYIIYVKDNTLYDGHYTKSITFLENNKFRTSSGWGSYLEGTYSILNNNINCIVETYESESGGLPKTKTTGEIQFKIIDISTIEVIKTVSGGTGKAGDSNISNLFDNGMKLTYSHNYWEEWHDNYWEEWNDNYWEEWNDNYWEEWNGNDNVNETNSGNYWEEWHDNYWGEWYESEKHFSDKNPNNLTIKEIKNNEIIFDLYTTRTAQFDNVKVKLNNNKGNFEAITEIGLAIDESKEKKITGSIEFKNDTITLKIDTSNVAEIANGKEIVFRYKDKRVVCGGEFE